ncbi:hypothetical protein [Spirosoma lacussanchae]|uniref:hypothetical protein n=1 Tax=Spirosoma lacussanchae TaxID=1884249 RepID=UPI00110949C0|nr:hypothetical protein [Spirosoma lacussanchae]
MRIWRVAGVVLLAGMALFLLSLLIKLLLVAAAAFLVVRVVGGLIASQFTHSAERVGWHSPTIISIDNSAYRSPMSRVAYDRVIPIH